MKSAALALLLVTSTAHAGGYVGLGVGDGIGTSGDLEYAAEGRTFKLIGGMRFGKLAIEGSGQRADVLMVAPGRLYTMTQLGVAGKYSYPLSDGFEVYGKLGLNHISMSPKNDGLDGSGNGFLFGGGVEYRSKLPVTFWVDYTVTSADVTIGADYSLTTRQWMLGASLGI
jgi:hypothetical protein